MKRSFFFLLILALVVLVSAGTSQGFQGRMGGMGDPYGLVSDESDFLIHPAKIATGEGVRFYGGYRFTYTGVTDWGYDLDRFTAAGILYDYYHFDTSGQEYAHDALVGAAFPMGPGRMGLFFTYNGMRGDYDGDEFAWNGTTYFYPEYDLTSDLDDFALRLLYGMPVGDFNLGGEVQFAYRQGMNEDWIYDLTIGDGLLNFPAVTWIPWANLFPFILPYDSTYWEALFKGSMEGTVGPLDIEFTLRGGFIFGGDNELENDWQSPVGTPVRGYTLDGDVEGWRIGGDLWLRYPVDSLTLPFLVTVEYQEKNRDGDGAGWGVWSGDTFDYEHKERSFEIAVGGGVEKQLDKGTIVAAGIYYNYLDSKNGFVIEESWPEIDDSSEYPNRTEHQVIVRFAGEHEISPVVTLRMGLDFFYGWVREGFVFSTLSFAPFYAATDDITLRGYRWGIEASMGGSVKFQRFTLEPFINAGYQDLNLDGDGDGEGVASGFTDSWEWEMDKMRREWYVGGGLSVLFDLP